MMHDDCITKKKNFKKIRSVASDDDRIISRHNTCVCGGDGGVIWLTGLRWGFTRTGREVSVMGLKLRASPAKTAVTRYCHGARPAEIITRVAPQTILLLLLLSLHCSSLRQCVTYRPVSKGTVLFSPSPPTRLVNKIE